MRVVLITFSAALFLLLPPSVPSTATPNSLIYNVSFNGPAPQPSKSAQLREAALDLYGKFQAAGCTLSQDAFLLAMEGYDRLMESGRLANDRVLTVVDFSKSSREKRLFVLDLRDIKVLFNTYVAHGMNSGKEFAQRFSNKPGSKESSLGFYLTMNAYSGKDGLALRLRGLDHGFNDKALQRAIVLHGAKYVSERYARLKGFMGRSEGCPAVPQKYVKGIVKTIRDGSALFIYYPNPNYIATSKLLDSSDLADL